MTSTPRRTRARTPDRDGRIVIDRHHRGGHRPGGGGARAAARCHAGEPGRGASPAASAHHGRQVGLRHHQDAESSIWSAPGGAERRPEPGSGVNLTAWAGRQLRRRAAVNQALANYASQWYVEEVRTLTGGWSCGSDSGHEALIRHDSAAARVRAGIGASPWPSGAETTPLKQPKHDLNIFTQRHSRRSAGDPGQ